MVLTGALINGAAVFAAGILGALIKNRLPKRIGDTVMKGIALCIIYIGIKGALSGENAVIAVISIAVGAVIGEWIDFDKHINRFGDFIQNKVKGAGNSRFSEGLVTVSLLVCVGAWAITGAMDAGIRGDHSSYIAKAVVDFVSTLILATTLGIGTAFAGIVLFVYQGALTLLSTLIQPFLTETVVNELTCVGSLLIIAIGLNMLGITKIKVVNLLPAVFLPLLLCQFM